MIVYTVPRSTLPRNHRKQTPDITHCFILPPHCLRTASTCCLRTVCLVGRLCFYALFVCLVWILTWILAWILAWMLTWILAWMLTWIKGFSSAECDRLDSTCVLDLCAHVYACACVSYRIPFQMGWDGRRGDCVWYSVKSQYR
jgi:hypothetical protein